MKRFLSIILSAMICGTVSASEPMLFVYKLHGQTRKFQFTFTHAPDGSVTLSWGIERNTKWQSGSFTMTPQGAADGTSLSFLMPEDGHHVTLTPDETYAMVSRSAYQDMKRKGSFTYDNVTFRADSISGGTVTVSDSAEGCTMRILDNPQLPLIVEMSGNPLEINWKAEYAPTSHTDIRAELRAIPEKTAGIYYAYPSPTGSLTPPPAGYRPFYISHYGRHGSRWITADKRYTDVLDVFDSHSHQLTPLGHNVHGRLKKVWDDARGHGGELTPLGHRQHHDIGERMIRNYPEVFEDHAAVSARSSTAGRCMMSMAAFCEGLKEINPSLQITREAAQRHMDYIAYTSPEAKELGSEQAPWRAGFHAFEDSVLHPGRLVASLFTEPDSIPWQRALYEALYWIASDMQNVEPDITFYDIFTPDELFDMWQTINYRMYVANANSPVGQRQGPESSVSLLSNILLSADEAISSGTPAAHLRFGHDTNLIRLLALIGIEGCDNSESDPRLYCTAWQDFRISPMAANLYMVFYRNPQGHILVKFLHNERETSIPVNTDNAPYYDWDNVRHYFSSLTD